MAAQLASIHYTRGQVASMVRFALEIDRGFARMSGEISARLTLIGSGLIPPTPAVLDYFGLEQRGRGYRWSPR